MVTEMIELKQYDPLEIASLAINISIGCSRYLYYLRKDKDINESIIERYFKDSERLIDILIKAYESKAIKRLIGGGRLKNEEIIQERIKELEALKEIILEKIPEKRASDEEVKSVKKVMDSIAWHFMVESHVRWLKDIEKYVIRT